MTTAEKILIRWLSGISAAVSAAAAVIIGADLEDISRTLVVVILGVSAGLAALVAAVTTQEGSERMGTRRSN